MPQCYSTHDLFFAQTCLTSRSSQRVPASSRRDVGACACHIRDPRDAPAGDDSLTHQTHHASDRRRLIVESVRVSHDSSG